MQKLSFLEHAARSSVDRSKPPNGVDLPRRSIVREPDFEAQLARLFPDQEQADDFTAAAESILSADPEEGVPASQDGLVWYMPMQPVRDRRVSLFYSFDESTVVFLAILASDD